MVSMLLCSTNPSAALYNQSLAYVGMFALTLPFVVVVDVVFAPATTKLICWSYFFS
jgi:hypothetical protein